MVQRQTAHVVVGGQGRLTRQRHGDARHRQHEQQHGDADRPPAIAHGPQQATIERATDPARLIRKTGFANLDLLPADESIRAIEAQLTTLGKRKRIAKLAAQLGKDYERIVIDCPPVLGETSAQVMRAADVVIVPLPPSPLSARAFDLVAREVKANADPHPPILPVLSMLDLRRSLHKAARDANPDWPVIPYSSAAEQCAVQRQPVGAFAPGTSAAQAFARLWTAIERKLAKR